MASAVKSGQPWTFTLEGSPDALQRTTLAPLARPSSTELHIRVKAAALTSVDDQLMNPPVWEYLPSPWVPPEKGIGELEFDQFKEAFAKLNTGRAREKVVVKVCLD